MVLNGRSAGRLPKPPDNNTLHTEPRAARLFLLARLSPRPGERCRYPAKTQMNTPYFICETCKVRVESGYRWAISHLHLDPKIVEYGESINANEILECRPFWNLPNDREHSRLRELLPIVRSFIECHEKHGIRFGDDVSFPESYFEFEWLDISPSPALVPRYFVEKLKYQSWQEVQDYVNSIESEPWWWNTSDHPKARQTFERMVANAG